MTWALWLLLLQGILGALDTLYYHEWRGRLVAYSPRTSPELRLHAARDGIYAIIMSTLPWLAWQGGWALGLAALLAAEIILTLTDFVVEDTVRRTWAASTQGARYARGDGPGVWSDAGLSAPGGGVVGCPDRSQRQPSRRCQSPYAGSSWPWPLASCYPGSVISRHLRHAMGRGPGAVRRAPRRPGA
jgi:hypothetical protein